MPMILRVEGTVSLRFRCKYITQKENIFQYPFITKNIFIFCMICEGVFFTKNLQNEWSLFIIEIRLSDSLIFGTAESTGGHFHGRAERLRPDRQQI